MDFGFSQIPLGGQVFGTPCSNLISPVVLGAEILRINAAEVHNFSLPDVPFTKQREVNNLSFCNVSVVLTHPGADDMVHINLWLPSSDWNGRYQAMGGGGLAAGYGEAKLASQIASGYVASSTDAGLTLNNTVNPLDGEWALKQDGSPNEDLLLNLAWRSIHDMVVVSKDVIKQFYGREQTYSYWHGCSQGGRQGYAAAAKYPHDFDGILAIAPAISITSFVPADFWPPVVMQNSEVPPFCVFEAYQKAIIVKCDPLDGVEDGLISDSDLLETCPFDPASLIGTKIPCRERCIKTDPITLMERVVPCHDPWDLTITATHAEIVTKLLEGPRTPDGTRLWNGIALGASFFAVADTIMTDEGIRIPRPFDSAMNWLKFISMRNASYDMSEMDYSDFYKAFNQSRDRLDSVWGNQQLDLSGFKQSGGKLLTWYGLADEFIPPAGMLRYRDSVEEKFGGTEEVDEFYRLFLAPGGGHCYGGYGPLPVNPLEVLVSWVEREQAPEVLPAAIIHPDGVKVTRNLCRYPRKLIYKEGDVNQASSFACQEI